MIVKIKDTQKVNRKKNKKDDCFSLNYQIKIEITLPQPKKIGEGIFELDSPQTDIKILLKEKKCNFLHSLEEENSGISKRPVNSYLNKDFEYLQKHLPNALETLIISLLQETDYNPENQEIYNKEQIDSLLKEQEKALKKRLGIKRGPKPLDWEAQQIAYMNFIADCLSAIEQLKGKKVSINQSNVAELVINQEGDPEREFRRQLKKYGLTIKKLLEIYSQEGSESLYKIGQ